MTIFGPVGSTKVKLVFDTGAEFTMVDTAAIEHIDYSAKDGTMSASVQGATEDRQSGYMLKVSQFLLFGLRFSDLTVGAFDFEHFAKFGIRGVVGFDLIKPLHLEMDGPNGILKILSAPG